MKINEFTKILITELRKEFRKIVREELDRALNESKISYTPPPSNPWNSITKPATPPIRKNEVLKESNSVLGNLLRQTFEEKIKRSYGHYDDDNFFSVNTDNLPLQENISAPPVVDGEINPDFEVNDVPDFSKHMKVMKDKGII